MKNSKLNKLFNAAAIAIPVGSISFGGLVLSILAGLHVQKMAAASGMSAETAAPATFFAVLACSIASAYVVWNKLERRFSQKKASI